MRIAIIGSGIAGLGASYLLKNNIDVHLFENDNRFGGHSNTVEADFGGAKVPVDTGFIVYNPLNYPNLAKKYYKKQSSRSHKLLRMAPKYPHLRSTLILKSSRNRT